MRILLGVAVALLIILSALALAMYTGAISPTGLRHALSPQDPPRPPATAPPAASKPVASAQTPAVSGSPVGQRAETKRQVFGDWTYSCVAFAGDPAERCAVGQELSRAETKAFVFLSRFAQTDDGGVVGAWQTPDGVLLTSGVTIGLGNDTHVVIPYETCGNGRCIATANLDAGFLEILAGTEELSATIVGRNKRAVTLVLSVNGLAEALRLLKWPEPAPAEQQQ